jgi:succinate dehydrogenase/fumarate reductase flavoprotein subunit
MGGVGINERAEVLDLCGNPIPRLFAAGEVTGGVHGASRLGSCSITDCLVFGRIAGVNAALTCSHKK